MKRLLCFVLVALLGACSGGSERARATAPVPAPAVRDAEALTPEALRELLLATQELVHAESRAALAGLDPTRLGGLCVGKDASSVANVDDIVRTLGARIGGAALPCYLEHYFGCGVGAWLARDLPGYEVRDSYLVVAEVAPASVVMIDEQTDDRVVAWVTQPHRWNGRNNTTWRSSEDPMGDARSVARYTFGRGADGGWRVVGRGEAGGSGIRHEWSCEGDRTAGVRNARPVAAGPVPVWTPERVRSALVDIDVALQREVARLRAAHPARVGEYRCEGKGVSALVPYTELADAFGRWIVDSETLSMYLCQTVKCQTEGLVALSDGDDFAVPIAGPAGAAIFVAETAPDRVIAYVTMDDSPAVLRRDLVRDAEGIWRIAVLEDGLDTLECMQGPSQIDGRNLPTGNGDCCGADGDGEE